ncbi:MBL fold metallo-hydrolase [Roseospira goensis]|uniref:Glyoxylase-like metal-dependent hydrolase (Beta-lactamase superfamily II) n=1 Tax=Roseospira goensis TaxID=391922 RepID=A0A7W6RY75_9PROT|nr:MBL fold metallo-hydrolase [Roseospira goensis]MBB4284905.1 glyoxylase-like metal-dependent hydrolase (beta-lactamase superfamily II) [Roseospira goensis]
MSTSFAAGSAGPAQTGANGLRFPHTTPPEPGTVIPVAPGVLWVRMPLPFALDHINLWVLEDGDGWTLVDTGIATSETQMLWDALLAGALADRPVRRLICTHFHPDHMGLSGWLTDRLDAPLWAPLAEWAFGRQLAAMADGEFAALARRFYERAGCGPEMLARVDQRGNPYRARVVPHPPAVRRIMAGQDIRIGAHDWRVVIGHGHSPEHAGLWCPHLRVLISGDQVLPRISPNVSVWPTEPDEDPLSLFLASLHHWRATVDDDVLVLPSHGLPFRGLHARLGVLLHHHDGRLDETAALCQAQPRSAMDLVPALFRRELDDHQRFFAIGETLAHLHHLERVGRLQRVVGGDGAERFSAV